MHAKSTIYMCQWFVLLSYWYHLSICLLCHLLFDLAAWFWICWKFACNPFQLPRLSGRVKLLQMTRQRRISTLLLRLRAGNRIVFNFAACEISCQSWSINLYLHVYTWDRWWQLILRVNQIPFNFVMTTCLFLLDHKEQKENFKLILMRYSYKCNSKNVTSAFITSFAALLFLCFNLHKQTNVSAFHVHLQHTNVPLYFQFSVRAILPSKPKPAANTDKSKAPSKTAAGNKKPAKAGTKQGSIMSFFKKAWASAVCTKMRQDLVQQTVCCRTYWTIRSPARRLNWQLYLNIVRPASKKGSKEASVSCIVLL